MNIQSYRILAVKIGVLSVIFFGDNFVTEKSLHCHPAWLE